MTNTATLQALWEMSVADGGTSAWEATYWVGEVRCYAVLLHSSNGRRVGTLFQLGKRTSCDFTSLDEALAWFGGDMTFSRHTELEKQLAGAAKWAQEQTLQAEKEARELALQKRLDIATQSMPYNVRNKRVH